MSVLTVAAPDSTLRKQVGSLNGGAFSGIQEDGADDPCGMVDFGTEE
jgi:hypothetical protein